MFELNVPEMTCDHCVKTIRGAVAGIDDKATCDIDLGSKRVRLGSTVVPPSDFVEALEEVGYKSMLVPQVG
ncbi:MAG TPA: heavy-metal-associated domain-containing protein [Usitatibacter sp.]|nr:heavy-metal-associated domain-containing protein [Usitatibacter sp.]